MTPVLDVGQIEGRVASVTEELAGTELAADAAAAATTIEVVDLDGLDLDGGELALWAVDQNPGDGEPAQVIAYTIDEDSEGEVELADPLGDDYDAEAPVTVYPPAPERLAYILAPEQEEELEARIRHDLVPLLPTGTRPADDTAEVVVASLEDEEWVVTDILSQEPAFDGSAIIEGTQPLGDGEPPASSPTPTVTGIPGGLGVEWPAIENFDPVTYEVYVSTVNDFTPTAAEYVGEIIGTGWVVTGLSDHSPLEVGTTYYVKVVARDIDGAAAPGAQDSGTPVLIELPNIEPIDFTDLTGEIDPDTQIAAASILGDRIIANSLTANEIAANAITSAELAANAVIAGKIAAGTIVANDIASGAITTLKLAAGAVTANEIAAGTITATQLAATAIDAMTITGATYQTSSSYPKLELTGANGLRLRNSSTVDHATLDAANGLILYLAENDATPAVTRRLTFKRGSTKIADLFGYSTGTSGTDYTAYGVLKAYGASDAELSVESADSALFKVARVLAKAGARSVTVIDAAGNSAFPQVADPGGIGGGKKLSRGSVTVNPGANPNATTAAITHGITDGSGSADVPKAVVATASKDLGVGNQKLVCTIEALSNMTFKVTIRSTDGTNIGSGNVTIYWMAMG